MWVTEINGGEYYYNFGPDFMNIMVVLKEDLAVLILTQKSYFHILLSMAKHIWPLRIII